MKKYEVVKSSTLFNDIIHKGKYLKNKYFVIYYIDSNATYPHFGIAVGTKIGNAITRNKFKRQIRSIIDNNKNLFSKTCNYIIILKKASLELNYSELANNFTSLLKESK